MSNLLKSKFLLGVLVVAAMFVGVGFLGAEQAAADCSITTTLRAGSVGTEVQCLQTIIGATADGKFGPMTKAAVMAWQAGHGLVADGVVGAMTRAALMGAPTGNFPAGCTSASGYSATTGVKCDTGASAGLPAGCSSTAGYSSLTGTKCDSTGGSSSNGPLTGGAGSITVDASSEYSSEEVGEGEDDVKVLQFSVEADDESDVEISSVKVEFVESGATSSENLDDYAESVSVWFKGDKVGEADVEDFSETADVWTKSISLDGAVVNAGDEEDFVIAVTALTNLDSGDIDSDAWTVDVLNVRFEDGEGVVTTEDTDADLLEKTFDYADFASSADLNFKITLEDENVNDAHVINIDDTDTTDDVSLLSFNVEVEGDSDVTIKDLPVTVTTTETTGNDPDDLISTLYLYANGVKIGTESLSTADADGSTEVVLFDDVDYTIDAGDDVDFLVKAKIKATSTDLDDGDTIQVTFGEVETDLATFDAEDEEGEELADGDKNGTATADAHSVRDIGMNVKLVGSPTAEITHVGDIVGSGAGDDDQGTFVITFDVTAFDGDIYIDGTSPTLTGAGALLDLNLTETGTHALTSATITSPSGATLSGTANADARFLVEDGETERFTVTAVVTVSVDGFASIAIGDIVYALTDVTGTTSYTFNLDDFKTPDLFMNAN